MLPSQVLAVMPIFSALLKEIRDSKTAYSDDSIRSKTLE